MEQEARPVLDKLTLKISTLNLERVRQIKSRLVTISGRVQKVVTSACNFVHYLLVRLLHSGMQITLMHVFTSRFFDASTYSVFNV